jgi:hypothetical protein
MTSRGASGREKVGKRKDLKGHTTDVPKLALWLALELTDTVKIALLARYTYNSLRTTIIRN